MSPTRTIDGIRYTEYGGQADYDFRALKGAFTSPPHSYGPGFRLGKLPVPGGGSQWTLVDPDGKLFQYKACFRVTRTADSHLLHGTNQENRRNTEVIKAKYASHPSGYKAGWAEATIHKLRQWHYSAIGPFSDIVGPFPYMWHTGISMYARDVTQARAVGIDEPIKDISRCLVANPPGNPELFYRPGGKSPVGWGDWFDPRWAENCARRLSPAHLWLGWSTIAYAFEESDCVSRWLDHGHPNERAGLGLDRLNPKAFGVHLGMGILMSRLVVTSAVSPRTGLPHTFADTKNYSKAKLIANVKAKYGTIAALNAAYGTNGYYLTFDSDAAGGGWGKGRGFADEDGLRPRPWFGSGSPAHKGHRAGENNIVDSTSWAPAVKADLDQLMGESLDAYFRAPWEVLKARDPGLLFAPINNAGLPARPAAAAAIAPFVDLFVGGSLHTARPESTPERNAAWMEWIYSVAPKPHVVNYYNAPGRDPDSCLYFLGPNYPGTHTASAQHQNRQMRLVTFPFRTGSGDFPHVGITFWGWNDQVGEGLAWGKGGTLNDNPYDGEDRTFAQPDPWNPQYPIFTEDRVYTDLLGKTPQRGLHRDDLLVGANIRIFDVVKANIGLGAAPVPAPIPEPTPDPMPNPVPDPELPPEEPTAMLVTATAEGNVIRVHVEDPDHGWQDSVTVHRTSAHEWPGAASQKTRAPVADLEFTLADGTYWPRYYFGGQSASERLSSTPASLTLPAAVPEPVPEPTPDPESEPSDLEARVAVLEETTTQLAMLDQDVTDHAARLAALEAKAAKVREALG